MNIAMLAMKNIEKYGEYPFLLYGDKSYTNLELERSSNGFAYYLKNQGLKEDEPVMIILPNMPEVLISYQAILKSGAIIVPINDSLNKHEVEFVINHCEPTFIITNQANEHKIETSIRNRLLKVRLRCSMRITIFCKRGVLAN